MLCPFVCGRLRGVGPLVSARCLLVCPSPAFSLSGFFPGFLFPLVPSSVVAGLGGGTFGPPFRVWLFVSLGFCPVSPGVPPSPLCCLLLVTDWSRFDVFALVRLSVPSHAGLLPLTHPSPHHTYTHTHTHLHSHTHHPRTLTHTTHTHTHIHSLTFTHITHTHTHARIFTLRSHDVFGLSHTRTHAPSRARMYTLTLPLCPASSSRSRLVCVRSHTHIRALIAHLPTRGLAFNALTCVPRLAC